jgi:corrinoid protein of di/trimethylamine methyltransferase
MEKQQILDSLVNAIVEGDQSRVQEGVQQALRIQLDPLEVVEEGLSKGMAIVGKRFEQGDAFLPELLMAADTFNVAMEILKPVIVAQKREVAKAGKVLVGTVKGDIHHIGKDIVVTILETRGFDVVDMGVDVPSLTFIEEAQKTKADGIALSSVMTTTMPAQREVIEILKEKKLRDKYFVIVGGGPVTQKWADDIGADGYGQTAVDAVELATKLIALRK